MQQVYKKTRSTLHFRPQILYFILGGFLDRKPLNKRENVGSKCGGSKCGEFQMIFTETMQKHTELCIESKEIRITQHFLAFSIYF